MKRHIIAIAMIGLALTAGIAATARQQLSDRGYGIVRGTSGAVEPEALSSSARPCSILTIAGDWASRQAGKTPDGMDITGVGTFRLEKDGTSSAHGWSNVAGGFFFEYSHTGRTTVEADCTGTLTWEGEGAPPPAKFVILRGGREIWGVYDAPLFMTVEAKRIHSPL